LPPRREESRQPGKAFKPVNSASEADDRLPDVFFGKDYNAGQQPSKPQEWMEPMKEEFYYIICTGLSGISTIRVSPQSNKYALVIFHS
jgi:hypothetical protein